MDLWIDPAAENVNHANKALVEFGSPHLLEHQNRREILQLGVAPDRIDLLRHMAVALEVLMPALLDQTFRGEL